MSMFMLRDMVWIIRFWLIVRRLHAYPHVHDDVIKWKHFPRYWPFVQGIHRSPVNSPHKGQWRGASMFTLICARINGWVNNREAGDLRRYRGHYGVTVMSSPYFKAHPTMLTYCILITYRGRQLFNIFDIPAYFDISLDSIFAWDFRDKLSSKITKVFKPWNTFKLDAISFYGRYQSSYA